MRTKMFLQAPPSVFEKATQLRANQTKAEGILWEYLRMKPKGYKFRRQHPITFYILDFYCHALKLAIEVDGSIHDADEAKEKDTERQQYLEYEGLKFLRFTNREIEQGFEAAKQRIEEMLPYKPRSVND